MATIDLLIRVDAICKKYEKYDIEKKKQEAASGSDKFTELRLQMEADLEILEQKANDASIEKNRATVATMNAEIRRAKSALKEQIPRLEKLAVKRVKGLGKEDLAERPDIVAALSSRIDSVPDGQAGGKRTGRGDDRGKIKIDSVNPEDVMLNPEHYQTSEESRQFRQEFETRKAKQDEHLDVISAGLSTLKEMAGDIGEELDKQVGLVDEIETKVDKANADLLQTNRRLKETVTQLRSTRNFCIDIILMCIILGIAGYIYNQLR